CWRARSATGGSYAPHALPGLAGPPAGAACASYAVPARCPTVSAVPVGAARGSKKKEPALVPALEEAVADATAGDPVSGLRWTHKTTRKLAAALRRQGFLVSHTTIARLL